MCTLVQRYDELRLRLDPRADGSYGVLATTRATEAAGSFTLPFNDPDVGSVGRRATRSPWHARIDGSSLADAQRCGGALFGALFRDAVRDMYRDALAEARRRNRGLRLTLCLSGSPELADLPWEYLYEEPDFLSMSALTPVVRYLDLPRRSRPLPVTAPLRLLGIVSSPAEYAQLDIDRERENLQHALSGSLEAHAVDLQWLVRPTLPMLLRALRAETFHALHYIGHGAYDTDADQGVLLLEDDSGWSRPVSGAQLGMILHDFSSLRLVVLNACEGARASRSNPFSGVAGALVRRDIPAVIAMPSDISDEAAIGFAGGLYDAIAAGSPVDASLAAARLFMFAERSDDTEWGTPVLFMRARDGRIFDLPQVAPGSSPSMTARSSQTDPGSRRAARRATASVIAGPDDTPLTTTAPMRHDLRVLGWSARESPALPGRRFPIP